ncbi:MAG TPA: S53 family peptidase [Jatrophihabitans sp.]|nr:S53 family peptidase [Jatrophihabitans sp.]
MQKRRIAVVATAATMVLAGAVATAANASARPSAKSIPNTKPAWTAHAQHLGSAKASSSVNARVYLAPRGGFGALRQAALAVSTPGSASYHQFLTPAQYQAQFGISDATVSSVSSYLTGHGLHVAKVGSDNRYLVVRGTVASAEQAFGTQIERYRHHGQAVQAPAAAVTLPADVASSVLTVSGLDTTPHVTRPTTKQAAPPPAGFRNARPCSLYYGQIKAKYKADFQTPLPKFANQTLPYAPCGYTGPQFRAAYEGATTLDGTGVTVAITDAYAAPTIAKDANKYATLNGDGSYAPGQFSETDASKFTNQKLCGPSGWYGEETLDVEAVHAMAPGATIHYYGAASCFDSDLLDTLTQVVDDGTASLVSNSWGDVESNETADNVAAYESVFLQGALEGMSFLFSSGDNGDELANTGIKQADYPTSDPYVTSVGGTSTAIGANGNLLFETGWGTEKYSLASNGQSWQDVGFLYGAGGGVSALFNAPAYQQGVTGSAYRTTPDMAMDADPNTGMLIGETQKFSDGVYYDQFRIGGTSLASPLFAGMTALTIQHAGQGVGLLNPSIYDNLGSFQDVKGTPPDAGVVRVDFANGENASDGLLYSVRTFNQDSSLKVKRGYDMVTGVGSPTASWLTALG